MKTLIAVLLAAPLAFAAPKKGESKNSNQPTVIKANLNGLSAYVSMDFADTLDASGSQNNQSFSGTYSSERAFGFGAVYTVAQLENGIQLQAGGSYEASRVLSNFKTGGQTTNFPGAKPEVQLWTGYGQARAYLTPELSVYGGGNYNIPQTRNINGGNFRGQFGYQLGGSYAINSTLNVDGEYRTLNFKGSEDNQGVVTTFDNIRLQGFNVRGRYSF